MKQKIYNFNELVSERITKVKIKETKNKSSLRIHTKSGNVYTLVSQISVGLDRISTVFEGHAKQFLNIKNEDNLIGLTVTNVKFSSDSWSPYDYEVTSNNTLELTTDKGVATIRFVTNQMPEESGYIGGLLKKTKKRLK